MSFVYFNYQTLIANIQKYIDKIKFTHHKHCEIVYPSVKAIFMCFLTSPPTTNKKKTKIKKIQLK